MDHIHGSLGPREGRRRMKVPFEVLPWDSGLFGFRVARWLGGQEAPSIPEALPLLRGQGIRLLYLFEPPRGEAADPSLEAAGARRVDQRVVFGRALGASESGILPVHSYPKGQPTEDLTALALASGAFSRFRVDPRMPPACFESLYQTWIWRSTMREIADEVLVSFSEGRIQGMVTIRAERGIGKIGLIAVGAEARGQGLGFGLVRAAEAWARAQGAGSMEVATQGQNASACRLYARCGYQVASAEDVYHLWIDPEAP